jgi:hypothetical protein
VGPLFQGAFKAKLVDNDAYLAQLTRHIHLNPVAAGLVEAPADWPYSSYNEYGVARRSSLTRPGVILEQFASRDAYREFVEGDEEPGSEIIMRILSSYAVFD